MKPYRYCWLAGMAGRQSYPKGNLLDFTLRR